MNALGGVDPHIEVKAAPSRSWIALWAYGGVLLLLGQAVFRIFPIALEPLRDFTLSPLQTGLYWGWVVASVYLEGYRGFHLRFVPRVVRRVGLLLREPQPRRVALAPLFVMGFFDAEPSDKKAAWGVTSAVLIAVFVVRTLAQPWRGIIDGGVVAGLSVGMLSLLYGALSRRGGDAELAEASAQATVIEAEADPPGGASAAGAPVSRGPASPDA